MSLLESLIKNAGALSNLGELVTENPQVAQAAMSLFSSRDASVGGAGGLAGILGALQSSGLEDAVASWLGGGPNKPVAPAQLEAALGQDTLNQFAQRAGVPAGHAGALLAGILPTLVDQMTPKGQLPEQSGMEQVLGSLLGGLGRSA